MLYPNVGCRIDSAVTLLRYVKTIPEAVFCLNLFSHIVLLAGGEESGGGLGGKWELPPGLDEAVKHLLARFPVGEVALSLIPLSASALSFSLLAGGEGFVADWLIAAPLARIRGAIGEFGALRGREREGAGDAESGREQRLMAAAAEGAGREASAGVLGAALRRWGVEIENNLERKSSDAVIYRLACVLLMSPDAFLSLAFEAEPQNTETRDRERRRRQEFAGALGAVIPETLESLSALLSPVVSRRGDGRNTNHRISQLACASHVSRLASAFLCARCAQGYYAPVGGGGGVHSSAALSPGRESPEVSLARACGGLLQGLLDRRLGEGSNGVGGGDSVHRALLAVLNLLNALLVIGGGDAGLLWQEKGELALSLQESHAALSEVLATAAVATKRLTGWLHHAPDALAAFLQACVLWNAVEPSRNGFGGGSNRNRRLNVPFQVLGDVLFVGGGPCDTTVVVVGGGGSISRASQTRASSSTPRRVVRRSLLKVLALRCVESAAYTRFFSREEVLALQLTLQGVACDGSAVLASAALGALQALWEAYSGFVPSADMVGQSWNPFMVECSLENALRSLYRDQESGADLLRLSSDPKELRVDAPVLVSTIGRLLRWSAGKTCFRLSHSKSLGDSGGSLDVLPATAAGSIYKCAAIVAKNLCMALGDGMDQREDRQQRDRGVDDDGSSRRSDCSEYRLDEGSGIGDAELCLLDALVQVLPVLTCMESIPQENPVVGEGARRELAGVLSLLHPTLLRLREARPCLAQISMPLSRGAYHDCAADCGTLDSYEGVLFVKHDNWRALSSPSEPVSFEGLAEEIERLIGHLSGRPGARTRTGDQQDHQEGRDGGSNAMLVDVI